MQRSSERKGRLAPLAQAGLAALVAGSLLTFSTIAFNTAFDPSRETNRVAVSSPPTVAAEPVVLPTPPRAQENDPVAAVAVAAIASATVADDDASTRVLGLRIKRRSAKDGSVDNTLTKGSTKHGPSVGSDRRRTSGYDGGTSGDTHRRANGKGHIKARGKGHHKDHSHGHDAKSHGRSESHGSKSNGRSKAKKR